MPHALIGLDSPCSTLFKRPVVLNDVRPFGSLANAVDVSHARNKFDGRSITCVVFVVASSQKGFILYDLEGKP